MRQRWREKERKGGDGDSEGEEIHVFFTRVFVVAQVLYLFIWVSIFNGNMDKFKGFETHVSILNTQRMTVVLFGLFTVLADQFKIEGKWDAFLEWYAFMQCFAMYIVMANIMPFRDTFKFDKQQ